jgi:hypothetical protein
MLSYITGKKPVIRYPSIQTPPTSGESKKMPEKEGGRTILADACATNKGKVVKF